MNDEPDYTLLLAQKEAEYWEKKTHICEDTILLMADAIQKKWIPCSERLPKNRQYVLVTYQYEYGLIDHGITWYGEAEKKWNTSRKVTAWMPLPEPYKGD